MITQITLSSLRKTHRIGSLRAHKHTRNVVERGIGQMKRRFHVLQFGRVEPSGQAFRDHFENTF